MPIANCIISSACQAGRGDLIALWANTAGQAAEHMTINIIEASQQFGNAYPIMATLYLPSLWPPAAISSLQIGLAKSLAEYYSLPIEQVHVVTQIVSAGLVVENGEQESW